MTDTHRTRVLFVVPDLTVGGAERHIANVVPRLDRERFEARVCCIKEPGALFDPVRSAGIDAVSLDCPGGRAIPKAFWKLRREMRRFRPDVVVTRGFNAEVIGRLASASSGRATNVVWKRNCGDVRRSVKERVIDRLLDPFTDRYFGVAFGQVPYLVNDLGIAGHKIRIIRNGVEPGEFTPRYGGPRNGDLAAQFGIHPDERVVGILAVLRPEKDHATFLRAARIVSDRLPDTRFLIVGDGPCRDELEQLSVELGLGDRAVFAGMRSDVADMLSLCDTTVLASYTVECCPHALLEAMAAGVPSVCTAIGGLPEMIEEGLTGRLVPPFDPHGLAEAIVRVIDPIDRAREMGRAARARLEENFSLERSVREAEWVLEHVAGQPRAATS
ncbi:MAG: glycosyltransferase [Thermoleophilia bacterium]|nr:glycosyltransferase [Thermoleophilia bacterium]